MVRAGGGGTLVFPAKQVKRLKNNGAELRKGEPISEEMEMATFFTADLHLGHARIIDYCGRPFRSVEQMDAMQIANWNSVVGPQDDVWVVGDFCWGSDAEIYLSRLQGRKHLVWGNHDPDTTTQAAGWESSQPYAEITLNKQKIVLFHYGLRVWNRSGHGALHFYGHSHGGLLGDSQSCDVGVDCFDYRPVDLAAIRRQLRRMPQRGGEPDHHGRTPALSGTDDRPGPEL